MSATGHIAALDLEEKMKKKIFSILFALVLALSLVPAMAAQAPVDLGSAGNFAILAETGISTTGTTSIVGDIGVSPIDATAITGFDLIMDSSNEFSTSSLVTGKVYAADYAEPTPTNLGIAVLDMEAAYTDAAGRTDPDETELGAGDIGGLTLVPGLYKWSSGVTIPTDVTLSGGANDVWIFQIAGTLDISSGKKVVLSGDAQAKNIFWQVAGAVTLGTTSEFKGNILAKTMIAMNTGATLNGRALAQTAVTLIANTVVGITASDVEDEDQASTRATYFRLHQNYPNPFNPETEISYTLLKDCWVRLTIYNILGQRIKTLVDEYQTAGDKSTHWDGKDDHDYQVASGAYFYRLQAGEYIEIKKMELIK
jgi:hypothetical protein